MTEELKKVIFRADGNSEMGLGHLIRSSAFATAINKKYHCTLVTRCTLSKIIEDLSTVFAKVVILDDADAASELQLYDLYDSSSSLLILDGYEFTTAYQEALVNKGLSFICIDDIHAYRFYAKAIVNHSGGLTFKDYKAPPDTQFYFGPQYSLLRKPFLDASKQRRTSIDNRNCFVCFGGADPGNMTLAVLRTETVINQFDYFHVVVGAGFEHLNVLESFAQIQKNISLHVNLQAHDMVTLMQKCAFAICAPSTIVYEYMSVGGVVYLKQTADNQKDVISYMTAKGFAFELNKIQSVSKKEMLSSLNKQAGSFDGNSAERLTKVVDQCFLLAETTIRRAVLTDVIVSFNWANDPVVRNQSFSTETIIFENHQKWFASKMEDEKSFFYIIENRNIPVGQIRFQVANGNAVISYLADKDVRNNGMGVAILTKGIEVFTREYNQPVNIIGSVKNSNIASQRSFEKLAFEKQNNDEFPDSVKYIMRYDNYIRK